MSNGNVDGAMPANPLGFMKRLSPTVTHYEPTTSTISSGSGDARASPELILLSTWMGARENHIAKYVQEYRVIFPTSRILVAQCPFTHVVMPFLAWTQIRPAVPILKEVVESESTQRLKNDDASVLTGDPTTPRVLIHAFSNGGISTTLFLYNALKRSLGGQFALPQHVFIFDSCPGTFKWRNTARAIMKILPRWSSPAVHAVLFSIWLFYRVVPVLQPRQNVNSRTIRNPRFQEFEVRRTYLYGTDDQMIPPTDVEHEAGLAAEAGFNVRLERFEDATHVAIPMLHPERYWRVVKESWYGEEPATSVVIQGSDGSHASVAAEISSETVTKEISLVDHEKTISEEASILAEDIKNDGKESVKFAEKKAQEASISAQSVVRAASAKTENIRTQSRDIAEKAQSRAEDVKANADSAIEQGKATMKQFTANAAGFVKEVQIKANGQSENEASASAVEDLEAGSTRTIIEAKQRTKDAGKDAIAALHGVETKLNEATETKSQPIERPETPDTSTALQAALAAAAASSSPEATKNSSSLKTAGHQSSSGSSGGNGSGVQELAARFGGKVDKSTIKLPKAKASQAELAKMEEPVIVAKPVEQQPVEQKQVTPKSEVENKVPADQPKTGHPKPAGSTKSKKSKKNGKK